MPQQSPLSLTVNEASFVLGKSAKALYKAVEAGIIQPRMLKTGKRELRLFGLNELRYYMVARDVEFDLTPAGRKLVYMRIKSRGKNQRRVILRNNLFLDLKPYDDLLKVKLKELDALRTSVRERPGDEGDKFIENTKISVYLIAALADGQTIEEIKEDYPSLTIEQIKSAVDYAKIYPKLGRPYPKRSMKRMLADVGFGDIDMEPSNEGPRVIKE